MISLHEPYAISAELGISFRNSVIATTSSFESNETTLILKPLALVLKLGALVNVVAGFYCFGRVLAAGFMSATTVVIGIVVAVIPLSLASYLMSQREQIISGRISRIGYCRLRSVALLTVSAVLAFFCTRLRVANSMLPLAGSVSIAVLLLVLAGACMVIPLRTDE